MNLVLVIRSELLHMLYQLLLSSDERVGHSIRSRAKHLMRDLSATSLNANVYVLAISVAAPACPLLATVSP